MNVSGQDINQTLEYRAATALVRLLPTGLLLIFLGLLIFVLVNPDREPFGTFVGIVLCVVVGSAVIGLSLWRRSRHGKPLFTLSPAGIHYRIPWVKEFLIPWSEIRGVDTIDVETGYWSLLWSPVIPTPRYNVMVVRNVTVVLLSRQFYDSRIHVDSFFLRGPGWKASFIPKDSLVQMALHHELVSVEPRALREAVEARWHAFRNQASVAPARTSVPIVTAARSDTAASGSVTVRAALKSDVVAMGENPRAMSRWEATKIIVPLIGTAAMLANLAGLWDLPGQDKVREVRAKARAERKYWEESARRRKEESKQLEAEDKERQRRFEEDMRRTFGR